MAEYLIIGVSYSEGEKHIEWVIVGRKKVGGGLINIAVVNRPFIVDLIETKSASFKTATVKIDTKAKKYSCIDGEDVHVVAGKFLATNRNETDVDNLGNLPNFSMPNKEIDSAVDSMFGLNDAS